ncbi:hypothetical protein ATCC90586_003390 [Pythium insidiosum]|nr:hypothetical protein ATCC90586_003390 [Pythium insidiosum]
MRLRNLPPTTQASSDRDLAGPYVIDHRGLSYTLSSPLALAPATSTRLGFPDDEDEHKSEEYHTSGSGNGVQPTRAATVMKVTSTGIKPNREQSRRSTSPAEQLLSDAPTVTTSAAITMSAMSAASTTTMVSSSVTAMVASTTSEPRGEATKAQAETTETAAGAAVFDATASATSESEASSTRAAGNADNQDDSTGGDSNEHVARAQSMTSNSTAVTTAVSEASACADDGRVGTTAVDAVVHHDDDEGKAPVPKIASTSDASDVRSDQAASAPTETATADAGVSTA